MTNNKGNTAWYDASLAVLFLSEIKGKASKESLDSSVALALYLTSADPLVSYCPNKAGEFPLFLAVESGNMHILENILKALPEDDGSENIINWPEGKCPAHAAIKQRKLDALELIVQKQKQKLSPSADNKGNNPFHCAASEGYLDGVRYLLNINIDSAFEKNKKGLYSIHLACKNGYVEVLKELLRKWPDPTDLLTNEGRNILHVAAKSGKVDTVMCILQETKSQLVNEMDKDGNTPLHLAALDCHSSVVFILLRYSRSKSDVTNNLGMTAYDIAVQQYKMQNTEIFGRTNIPAKMCMLSILFARSNNFRKNHVKNPRIKNNTSREDVQSSINNLLVVATIIIGVAYAASIQTPSSEESGDASSSKSYMSIFGQNINRTSKAFVICNTSAMNMSVIAALMLCWAQLADSNLASSIVRLAYSVVGCSIYTLCAAFWCATYIGTERDITLDNVWVIFLFSQATFLAPLLFVPVREKEISVLYLRYTLFCYEFFANRLLTGRWQNFIRFKLE